VRPQHGIRQQRTADDGFKTDPQRRKHVSYLPLAGPHGNGSLEREAPNNPPPLTQYPIRHADRLAGLP